MSDSIFADMTDAELIDYLTELDKDAPERKIVANELYYRRHPEEVVPNEY